jgi:hypothetical protein
VQCIQAWIKFGERDDPGGCAHSCNEGAMKT